MVYLICDLVSSERAQQVVEEAFAPQQFTSAAEADSDFAGLAARLKAAPLRDKQL